MSTNSTINMSESSFIGLNGWFGAAMLITGSNINLTGSNAFVNNVANSGGAIHLFQSRLYLKGTSLFKNNTVKPLGNNTICDSREAKVQCVSGNGGALFCYNSTLEIEGDSTFIGNKAEQMGSGGATAATQNSKITIQYFLMCIGNLARDGGIFLLQI